MPSYTESERERFLELACEVGPHRARRELGYPGERTSTRWMGAVGLDWDRAPAQVRGRALGQAYSDEEELLVGAALLNEVSDRLDDTSAPPTPLELYRLSRVVMNVVLAREPIIARQRLERPPMTPASRQLLAEINERNEEVRRELEQDALARSRRAT